MKFTKYTSLENHYQEKFIEKIITEGKSEGEWVATEKVHGANFGFWFDGGDIVKTSKRSGFCEGDFFSSWKLDKYKPLIRKMHEHLVHQGLIEPHDTLVVFGEIFGGEYHGESNSNAKCVQKGVNYHPDTEFVVFDIGIESSELGDKYWMSYHQMVLLCETFHLPTAPLIGKGSFQEMLEIDNEFPTKVPEMFGLELPEGVSQHSIGEGVVIRPLYGERFLDNGSRIIIKSKNSKFSENGGKIKKPKTLILTEDVKHVYEDFSPYLNQNRIEAVQSKVGEPNWKTFGMVVGLTVKDAVEDFNKDSGSDLKKTVGEDWGTFSRVVQMEVSTMVRDYYKLVI